MKKTGLLFILFAVFSMTFNTSCKDEEEVVATPTIAFSASGISQELDFTSGDTVTIVFSVTVKAEGKISTFGITETKTSSSTTSISYDATTTDGFKGETDKTYYFDRTFLLSDFTSLTSIAYKFEVTDKESQTTSKTYTFTAKTTPATTPLSTESTLLWVRDGGVTATGLSTFGLKWTSNVKSSTVAVISTDVCTKFVELTSTNWTNITTQEDLKTAIDAATSITEFKGISTSANNTYNEVLGVINGGVYYVINITNATVVSGTNGGYKITIDGKYKN